jgi:uncharacterized protein (DUF433 family)
MDEDQLIACHVEENPERPGPAWARLRESGVEVWALVSYAQRAAGGDLAQVAEDYELPLETVGAAIAYYRRHQPLIDARIALNAA